MVGWPRDQHLYRPPLPLAVVAPTDRALPTGPAPPRCRYSLRPVHCRRSCVMEQEGGRSAATSREAGERPKLKRKEYEKLLRELQTELARCKTGSSRQASASSSCS